MPDRGTVIVREPAQVGIGLKIQVLRLEVCVERHEIFRKMIEEVKGQVGSAKTASQTEHPLPGANGPFRSAPGKQARADASPRDASDEEPDKTVDPRDGDPFPRSRVGLQMAIKKARPLHPTPSTRQADADRERKDDPTGSVRTRLPT